MFKLARGVRDYSRHRGGGGNIGGTGSSKRLPVAGMTAKIDGTLRKTSLQTTLDKLHQENRSLKVEHVEFINDAGFVEYAWEGDSGSVGYDPKLVGNLISTHNHPQSYGATFSPADVSGLSQARAMYASANEGVYSMSYEKGGDPQGLYTALMKAMPKLQSALNNIYKRERAAGASKAVARQRATEPIHKWYIRNAGKFGIDYAFTPNADYDITQYK